MNRQGESRASGGEKRHELHLLGRKKLHLCGVEEVVSFDEASVRLLTDSGELVIEGSGIHIGTLDTDQGVLDLEGMVEAMYYEALSEKKEKRRFHKLFG